MNVRPLHDRIIVHRLDEGEQRESAESSSPTARKRSRSRARSWRAGNGKTKDGEARPARRQSRRPHPVRQITPARRSKLDGKDYFIMKEDEVLAVIDRQDQVLLQQRNKEKK